MTPEKTPKQASTLRRVRCAIYCRKSSDDGLEQSFNSLDAQRESGEAYIASQKADGWHCLPHRYEDGGISGGTMERPAFQQLLRDVGEGKIDLVVVYKLDRLTRSLRDFGTVMDLFERKNVSLAAVTQSFNTATSSGRLMVHMLLSFAQFERELASERTRDKIALSRQRGQWMGGRPVLGYDAKRGVLTVNGAEAILVRRIFNLYTEHRAVSKVLAILADQGIRNKAWTSADGKAMGGANFAKSNLWSLLSNVLYVGKIPHHDKVYPGLQPPIVDEALFNRVQDILAENGRQGASLNENAVVGVLKGLLRCSCGAPMVHAVRRKSASELYRYYVCRAKQLSGPEKCQCSNAPASALEGFVLGKVRERFREPQVINLVFDTLRERQAVRLRELRFARSEKHAELEATGGPDRPSHLAKLEAIIREHDRSIAAAERDVVDRGSVGASLAVFDTIWASLSPTERNTLIRLVVAEVVFDASRGTISITPRSLDGIPPGEKQEKCS